MEGFPSPVPVAAGSDDSIESRCDARLETVGRPSPGTVDHTSELSSPSAPVCCLIPVFGWMMTKQPAARAAAPNSEIQYIQKKGLAS